MKTRKRRETLISKVRKFIGVDNREEDKDRDENAPSEEAIMIAKKQEVIKEIQRYNKGFTGGMKISKQGFKK